MLYEFPESKMAGRKTSPAMAFQPGATSITIRAVSSEWDTISPAFGVSYGVEMSRDGGQTWADMVFGNTYTGWHAKDGGLPFVALSIDPPTDTQTRFRAWVRADKPLLLGASVEVL